MRPHHERTIQRLGERFQADPTVRALLVGGSVVQGRATDDSDVDFMLVVTDEEFARREAAGELYYVAKDLCDYPGGYVDGKVVTAGFLEEVARSGSEPARSAFVGVLPVIARLDGLEALLGRITTYPEDTVEEKARSFYAQVLAFQWFVGECERRPDPYLLRHAATRLVLFGGRLILVHNRAFFPGHKWLLATLEAAPQKPAELLPLARALLDAPCQAAAGRFAECVTGFVPWDEPAEGWPSCYMKDVEWAWRWGRAPLDEC